MKLLPVVKWAGGKRQIIDDLIKYMPKKYNHYYEPFVGGGALFLRLHPKHATINDLNKDLICVYKCLRNKKMYKKFFDICKEFESNHSEEYYYRIRDLDKCKEYKRFPIYIKAARCVYLNKACFNGLYRVNSKGQFNVPSGKRENVICFDEKNIKNLHNFFAKTKPVILNVDFEKSLKTIKKGDFVYFDPPYDTLKEQSFTSYTSDGFGKQEQERLKNIVFNLTNKGVFVMLSNANTPFIQELYKDFNIHIINAKRNINSNGSGRGKVEELIITNY